MNQKATAAVLGAGSLWGVISIFVRNLNAMGLTAIQISLLRAMGGAAVMVLFLALTRRDLLKIKLRHIWYFVGTGIISLALFNLCYFTVIELSQASIAVVLLYTSPIFIMVISAIVFKEKITRNKLLALVMVFAGCVLVAGLLGGGYALTPTILLLGLGSGLFYGLYSIFGTVALRTYDTLTVATYTFVFATLGTLPFSDAGGMFRTMAAQPVSILWGIGVSLICAVAPYLLYTWGLSRMPSSRAAILVTMEPLVGALIGILLYQEPANPTKLLGMALIFGAVVVLNLGQKPEQATASGDQ